MDGSDVETLRPRAAGGSREDREAKTREELPLEEHHYIHLYVISEKPIQFFISVDFMD